ncbi:MAG TPA: ABC transporter substrate-binding protein [Casimicrobiaceae bacterium]|nr:ABC transporter substrate-binding protein [Casimicrobiaceae bacterium]
MNRLRIVTMLLTAAAMSAFAPLAVAQPATVRIGQAVPTMSFLPILAARALGSFDAQQLKLEFTQIRGGDPAALAALDSGNIDFAAVGSDTALAAIAKGQPFELVYSLMSQVTLDLVVSNDFLKRMRVSPGDPLQQRIKALKGATIGVSAVGGAQDRAVRWLVAKGGLDRQHDVKIALIGPPPAIQAALDHGQIDGYVLSPPEGTLSEQSGTGKTFIRLGSEFPQLANVPYLVLVAKAPMDDKQHDLAVSTARALQAASRSVLDDPGRAADEIRRQFYPKLGVDVVKSAIAAMSPGIRDGGKMIAAGISQVLEFTTESGETLAKALDPAPGPHAFWTNDVVDLAAGTK